VEAGGVAGSVEKVQAHATHLCTPDNKHIIVPNSAIVGANIINYSAKDRRRVDMVFGVGYRSDIKQVKTILQNALAKDPRVLSDPEPTVALGNLGASSLDFFVRPWVKTADYWGFFFDYQETIKNAFDQEGIEIPFPQSDVHLFVEADHRGQKG
jgi:small conductance mechanosensitive channel